MGHGDEIIVADANFPSDATARHCLIPEAISLAGLDAPSAIGLITDLMPLDGFIDYSVLRMQIDNQPDTMGDVHTDAWNILQTRLPPQNGVLSSIERQDFYGQAKKAFAVVHTSEARPPYGCFILRKGVV